MGTLLLIVMGTKRMGEIAYYSLIGFRAKSIELDGNR